MPGVTLWMSFAILTAYRHKFDVIAEGHLLLAWIIIALAVSRMSRILRSALPFIQCALTPRYKIVCPAWSMALVNRLSANIPLSAW
jgi:hypothetical protein